MRGTDQRSGSLFSYVDIEARVPKEHPLRGVRELVNRALSKLDKRFGELYSKDGRPSSDCCAPACCSCSIRSGQSASSWSEWISIFCFAGL